MLCYCWIKDGEFIQDTAYSGICVLFWKFQGSTVGMVTLLPFYKAIASNFGENKAHLMGALLFFGEQSCVVVGHSVAMFCFVSVTRDNLFVRI